MRIMVQTIMVLYIEIKNKCWKKCPSDEINVAKKCTLFSSSTNHSFTFHSGFLYELKRNVHLSKNVYGTFHFQFCFGFIRVYIFVQQKHELFDFKTPWFSSKLKQVAASSFRIQWYLRELLISKNWPGQGFFKLWKSRCFSRVTFKWVFGV